ncbi:MAG: hypothetical protein IJI03_12445 [Rudaea sp.]|nr:hypothetical protein [Rudaea sp.]
MRESRQSVLLHHINMAVQNSAMTKRRYATCVRDQYDARTPAALRSIRFHATRDPYSDERLNEQTLRRLLDDADDIPVAIEEALVLALPQPFQRECRRELAARLGELAAPMPTGEHGAAVANAATLMRETGEALADLAQCFDGETIPPDKRAVAMHALGELDDVTAQVFTIKTRLEQALAARSPVVPLNEKKAG